MSCTRGVMSLGMSNPPVETCIGAESHLSLANTAPLALFFKPQLSEAELFGEIRPLCA